MHTACPDAISAQTHSNTLIWPRELFFLNRCYKKKELRRRRLCPVSPITWLHERKFTQKTWNWEDSVVRQGLRSQAGGLWFNPQRSHERTRLGGTRLLPQCWRGEERQIPRVHWPPSLAYFRSHRSQWETVSQG